ncbi:transglutaminase domain-containing protein [Gloeocapsopsis dulcis]|uniref:Transglutaminase n=1 Tax=Gloeocapsopsis dulcis AAB1 = 1H9 TaxID=1433147 RepID=A0A6N8FYT5_9CHRO|nr:transglutaminase domain-containing protein [Gloeocapsopsis dulcis]MUL38243.1 transglutaminase [Gloeocapsopsis dulcis AAB1 = 1H9]WNN91882.1 transglutaminase domain-containing protein [Gloeocapsopsis dulcis]
MIATPTSRNSLWRTIRPIGAAALHGIAFVDRKLIAIDTIKGHLLEIDLANDNTTIINPHATAEFIDATGIALWEDTLWLTRENTVYCCQLGDFKLQEFVSLPHPANGVAVWQNTVYVTCQKMGDILIFDRQTKRQITQFYAPGVGVENITVRDEELWVCDTTEQSVYCLERATGNIKFSVLTPFAFPTGLAFYRDQAGETLYVAYADEEAYIRDNPNAEPSHELTYRDRTFVHPLDYHYNPTEHFALSNGYLLEMIYTEEIAPLEDVSALQQVEWRIALPAETDRQKVKHIEPVGLPFTEEVVEGQRVAVFKFDSLQPSERHIFGWKALVEVRGIKYRLIPRDVENLPDLSPEFQARYLVDDDELAMDQLVVRRAAKEAVGTETNLLRKVYKIRNYVYDELSYGIKPHIDTPDVVLDRGIGSCGEYVGVLLALLRLNGIACRTIGRYKCPAYAEQQGVPLQPDFNHVWLEFYVPGLDKWLPMESNPDDVGENGPYPSRFFMGLAWYHIEIGKGISFETVTSKGLPLEEISLGDIAINHIRFTIVKELLPE